MLSPINLNSYLHKHKKNLSINSNNGQILTLGNCEPEENIEEEKQRKSGVNQIIQSDYIRGKQMNFKKINVPNVATKKLKTLESKL
jgi:hypothetical protein